MLTDFIEDEESMEQEETGGTTTQAATGGMCPNEASPRLALNATKLRNLINNLTPSNTCPSTATQNQAPTDVRYQTARERKRRILGDNTFDDFEWSSTRHFKEEWIRLIERHQTQVTLREQLHQSGIVVQS